MHIKTVSVKVSRKIPIEEWGSAGAEMSLWVELEPQETENLDEIAHALWHTTTENVRAQLAVFRQKSYAAAEGVYLGLPEEIREKFPPPQIAPDIVEFDIEDIEGDESEEESGETSPE